MPEIAALVVLTGATGFTLLRAPAGLVFVFLDAPPFMLSFGSVTGKGMTESQVNRPVMLFNLSVTMQSYAQVKNKHTSLNTEIYGNKLVSHNLTVTV